MGISARNQLQGEVSAVVAGAVNDEITVTLQGGDKLVAVVTCTSREAMRLAPGRKVTALVKAPWVILADAQCDLLFSARNQFACKVVSLERGAVNSTVHLQTANGLALVSVITNEAVDEMSLKSGSQTLALVKASSVVLAVPR